MSGFKPYQVGQRVEDPQSRCVTPQVTVCEGMGLVCGYSVGWPLFLQPLRILC
jgi:hypothetical protein